MSKAVYADITSPISNDVNPREKYSVAERPYFNRDSVVGSKRRPIIAIRRRLAIVIEFAPVSIINLVGKIVFPVERAEDLISF
jgi:hypothetical protein